MYKFLLPLIVVGTLSNPPLAVAADATSDHSITGNIGLFSSYRFRGIDQTFGKPALQGGIDYVHASGIYLGNWNSNVQQGAGYPDAELEMDFYGGYKTNFGSLGLDIGAIHYAYPGSDSAVGKVGAATNYKDGRVHSGGVSNTERYLGASWQFLSVKYYHAISDYFSTPGTRGSSYLDLAVSQELGDGWGVNGHVGRLNFQNQIDGDYTDWRLGVTKDIQGWVMGATYIGTSAKGNCATAQTYCFANSSGRATKDAGSDTLVVSIGRSF
jgi:uncharacterized protein (TIGR02001 family)